MKRYLILAVSAFFLNLLWENLHYVLYVHYKGGVITEWILLHATLADMVYITLAVYFVRMFSGTRALLILIPAWVILAVAVEWWALATGRWAYATSMPIVPFFHSGLSPTIQLAITGGIAYKLAFGRR